MAAGPRAGRWRCWTETQVSVGLEGVPQPEAFGRMRPGLAAFKQPPKGGYFTRAGQCPRARGPGSSQGVGRHRFPLEKPPV